MDGRLYVVVKLNIGKRLRRSTPHLLVGPLAGFTVVRRHHQNWWAEKAMNVWVSGGWWQGQYQYLQEVLDIL